MPDQNPRTYILQLQMDSGMDTGKSGTEPACQQPVLHDQTINTGMNVKFEQLTKIGYSSKVLTRHIRGLQFAGLNHAGAIFTIARSGRLL